MTLINNEWVTYDDNILEYVCKTSSLQEFYNECVRINTEESRPFTFLDFQGRMTNDSFRQRIYKLREVIVLENRSTMGQYCIRGVSFSKKIKPITFERKGVGDTMLPILSGLRSQPPAIHNIKIRTTSNNLYAILKSLGAKEDPHNHGVLHSISISPYITKIQAYENGVVQIDIGCTSTPIAYSIQGVLNFTFFLGRFYESLLFLSGNKLELPSFNDWIITQYHFGKDGKEELSGSKFERRMEDLTAGLIRFYSKEMPDGKLIPRIELIESPHRRLKDEIALMIREEMISE